MTGPEAFKITNTAICVTITFVLLFLSGCQLLPQLQQAVHTVGEPFGYEQLKNIKRGVTKKSEILKWFGPPAGIARKGEVVQLPLDLDETIRPSTVNDYFASRHDITDKHVTYCYYYIEVSYIESWISGTVEKELVHTLWVLINKDSGLVEDYMLKKEDLLDKKGT